MMKSFVFCGFVALIYFFNSLTFCGKIQNLPGFSGSISFNQYSGYIEVDKQNGRFYHYWYTESQNDPKNDPLLLFLNGGPGCSSMIGLLTENGPFSIFDNLTVVLNPFSWNLVANVVWLESPCGVGYSYSTHEDYSFDDNKTALDNLKFLLGFVNEFPELKRRSLYLAGESYAGHYIPQLAYEILRYNERTQSSDLNLQGIMAGNPCTDGIEDANSYVPFLAQHALASLSDYENANINCGGHFVSNSSAACKAAIQKIFNQMGTRINPYNIYAKCIGQGPPSPGYCFTLHEQLSSGKPFIGGQTIIPCMNISRIETWLNSPDVRAALYITQDVNKISKFTACSQILNYNVNVQTVVPIYNILVKSIRVLFYSGDVDSCLTYLGTEKSIRKIIVSGKTSEWTAWYFDDQVAGYTMTLGDNVTFLTVKDAGHMVPTFKPAEALQMFINFLKGISY